MQVQQKYIYILIICIMEVYLNLISYVSTYHFVSVIQNPVQKIAINPNQSRNCISYHNDKQFLSIDLHLHKTQYYAHFTVLLLYRAVVMQHHRRVLRTENFTTLHKNSNLRELSSRGTKHGISEFVGSTPVPLGSSSHQAAAGSFVAGGF